MFVDKSLFDALFEAYYQHTELGILSLAQFQRL